MTPSSKLNTFLDEKREQTMAFMRSRYTHNSKSNNKDDDENTSKGLSEEELEDVYQEASLALYRNIADGRYEAREGASLYTYFVSIVKNQALKALREKNKIELEQLDDESTDYDEKRLKELEGGSETEDEKAQHERLQMSVQLVMNGLSEMCQQLLQGHYVDNLSWEKVATMNGLANANSARATANRCRNQFRERFNSIKARIYG